MLLVETSFCLVVVLKMSSIVLVKSLVVVFYQCSIDSLVHGVWKSNWKPGLREVMLILCMYRRLLHIHVPGKDTCRIYLAMLCLSIVFIK